MSRLQDTFALVDELNDDEFSRLIDYIRVEVKQRQRKRNAKARAALEVGTKVRFRGPTRPQYLTGLTGEVIELKESRVLVKLDHGPVGKFKSGRILAQPGSLEVLV